MGVNAFQQFFMAGSAIYFRHDPIGGVGQPWRDLGVIKTASPKVSDTIKQIFDGRSGRLELNDQRNTKRMEDWDAVLYNLNHQNLRLLFGSSAPEPVNKFGVASKGQLLTAYPKRLLRLSQDPDNPTGTVTPDGGNPAVNITSIIAISTYGLPVTAVNTVSKTVTINAGVGSDLSGWTAGLKLIQRRGTTDRYFTSLTVASIADDTGGIWTITVVETPHAYDATQFLGFAITENTDWEWYDKTMGVIRILKNATNYPFPNATPLAPVVLDVAFTYANVDMMQLAPGAGVDTITGDVEVWWADNDNETRGVRAARCTVGRNGLTLGAEDFNELTLSFAIRSDRSQTNRMGVWRQVTGAFPSKS